jgi:hypothetical protein
MIFEIVAAHSFARTYMKWKVQGVCLRTGRKRLGIFSEASRNNIVKCVEKEC